MPTISEQITQLTSDRDDLVANLTTKGITGLTGDETFTELVPEVLNIPSGGSDEWQPEPDWWDIEQILKDDTEDYPYKAIQLITDNSNTTFFSVYGQGRKVKTSDGAEYILNTTGITHTWDKTKDKPCSKGYKTRYVIMYSDSIYLSNYVNFGSADANCLYIIFSGYDMKQVFNNIRKLECVKSLNEEGILTGNQTFRFNYNLKKIDAQIKNATSNQYTFNFVRDVTLKDNFMTISNSHNGDCSNMFSNSSVKLPSLNSDLNVKNGNFMFSSSKIEVIPSWIKFDNVTNLNSIFSDCRYLRKIESRINMINITSSPSMMFYYSYSLEEVYFSNVKVPIPNLNEASFLKHDCIVDLLNNLVDLTGETSKTLTLGATNLSKLTAEEKAIATNKNWTLA